MAHNVQNIVLIGMPGCGKTTVGKALARRLGKKFIDADREIIRRTGKTIQQLFAEEGEHGFRRIETQVISELGGVSGCVIATGGGCVLREENYSPLHRCSLVCWLHRDISLLPREGRPLSQSGSLAEMLRVRSPHYAYFADISVANDSTVTATAEKITEVFYEIAQKRASAG